MAEPRAADGITSATAADARGTGTSGPRERRGTNTVGVYDRPAWWQSKKGAVTIAASVAGGLLTLFFYLAAG